MECEKDQRGSEEEPAVGGPGVSQGAGVNVFRQVEKRYQLHKDQVMKRRNGRLRGGKYVTRPTDCSDLIDVHDAHSVRRHVERGVLAKTLLPQPLQLHMLHAAPAEQHGSSPAANGHAARGGGSDDANSGGSDPPATLGAGGRDAPAHVGAQTAFTLSGHPGFFLIPGALPPSLQLSLMRAALEQLCEPPANTNHTRSFGRLPGLWAAAQADLNLDMAPQQDARGHAQAGPCAGGAEGSERGASTATDAASTRAVLKTPDGASSSAPDAIADPGQATACAPGCRRSTSAAWTEGGAGPSARHLLRKLRWATIGPQFNWTARSYDFHSEHRVLPPELKQIATQVAAAVHAMWSPRPNTQAGGSSPTDAACAAAQLGSCPEAARRPFHPDAAIINYYWEGDTLGGHLDDVEPDMDQPIVTMSLGCDAAFLMGGPRRDMAPVPLRLRSGDVVVLAGEARRCYHGMPRVFADHPLPDGLQEHQVPPRWKEYVKHMSQTRVNISVRAVT